MKQVKIQDLQSGTVKGVEVCRPDAQSIYRESFFEWYAFNLEAQYQTSQISGGVLRAWHHVPVFTEIETHVDDEMFYFVSGIALMLFMDLYQGEPDLASGQIVRIKPGTQLIISAGKAHFVPVAEGDEPVEIIVVSPKMDAPRVHLPEPIMGVV